ncbi:olfactory receptor 13A1-like, partial [Choloepus didactylus]|uniref:olfactory receptor 13A1-like n=1 Tax=Choloepus didactylus TaxID=27675 RepID=UPI0018A071ED
MAANTHTALAELVLQGSSEYPQLQGVFSALFFLLYLMALTGNGLILMAICLNPFLHTATYFFLINLPILDIVCMSTILPKLLEDQVGKGSTIFYQDCMTQLFFLTWFLRAELLLLTLMACDCYVAICQPLQYHMLMSRPLCVLLAGSVWEVSGVSTSVPTGLMAQLMFCGSRQIHHFLCEVPTLLLLACGPTCLSNNMIVFTDVYFGLVNFLLTMVSYGFIVTRILHIHSTEGKHWAFSTCSSHLLVVCIYYSTGILHLHPPGSGSSMKNGKVVAIMYKAVSPMQCSQPP